MTEQESFPLKKTFSRCQFNNVWEKSQETNGKKGHKQLPAGSGAALNVDIKALSKESVSPSKRQFSDYSHLPQRGGGF